MPSSSDDSTRPYGVFLQRLAGMPIVVSITSLALTIAVTFVVLVLEPAAVDILGVIGLGATLWGLTLALIIYLLTAQDTNKVLDQIADLHEQLAASLTEPDEITDEPGESSAAADAEADEKMAVAETTPENSLQPAPETVDPQPDRTPDPTDRRHNQVRQLGSHQQGNHPWGIREDMFYKAGSGVAIEDRVPAKYVQAWHAMTGRDPNQILRAWTRSQNGTAPWVLVTADGTRWSVFSPDDDAPSVIQLPNPPKSRDNRWNIRFGGTGGGRPPLPKARGDEAS